MHPISLFLESAYSFNGSNIKVETLVKDAFEKGYKVLALTDKKMHGAYKFYTLCKKHNIKPILGLQVKLEGILELNQIDIVCYAKNNKGYRNLLKIASLQAYNDTIPLSLFAKYRHDLSVVLYPFNTNWKPLSLQDSERIIHEIKLVSDDFYIAKNERLLSIDSYSSLALDFVYFHHKNDLVISEILLQIFQQDSQPQDTDYFKEIDELSFEDNQTKEQIAFINNHSVEIEESHPKLPRYPNAHNLSSAKYLEALSYRGLDKRLSSFKGDQSVYQKRLKKELETIIELGYPDYFLIVWDVVRFAKKEGILVGPGRGSAPGSLVAYVLGITEVDPIKHDLLFERFLNRDRINMPDIDIDFPDYSREKIIKYTETKYGKEYVSHICTFGTFLKKSALRDSARVLNIDAKYINEMSRKIERYDTIEEMIEDDKDVQNRRQQNTEVEKWLNVASRIEGLPRHVSTHAAGIILSSVPIIEYTPIQPGLQGIHQSQYGQDDLEKLGLLKMDFLGLRNLTMIEDILNYIEENTGKRLNIYKLPLDDQRTFKMLQEKSTTGLFQLESPGMRKLIKDMKIKSFEDIVTVLALFRPGPMDSKEIYLSRREKRTEVTYLTKALEPILSSTQGILLYQEQIMAIASKFAGYSMNEADLLRRAVSKKDESVLQKERQRFVKKSVENGYLSDMANETYDYIVKFANYGFNKSHSVAYAMIAYWMAYLKAHHPAFFIAVLMQNALGNENLMKDYMQEAMSYSLQLEGPTIKYSKDRFVLIEGTLYYPLIGIKNIGKTVYKQLEDERSKKPFSNYVEFIHRTQDIINQRAYHYLIYAGALDMFKQSRKTMIENIEAVQRFKQYEEALSSTDFVLTEYSEYTLEERRHYEKEALGFLWMENPLKPYLNQIQEQKLQTIKDIEEVAHNQTINVVGFITRIKEIRTKKGDLMAFLSLSDALFTIDSVLFPQVYERYKETLNENQVYRFTGYSEQKKSSKQFIINRLEVF